MKELTKDPCASMGMPPKDVLQKFATQYARQNPSQKTLAVRKPFRGTNTDNPQESDLP